MSTHVNHCQHTSTNASLWYLDKPWISVTVEIRMKNMDKNRYFQIRSGKYTKTKVAYIQRLYSKWLWLVMTVYKPLFSDAENIEIAHIIDVQIVVYDAKCVGDILGTEFCWPKEKRANIKSLFTPYRRLCLPKIWKINVIRAKGQL